MLRVLWLGGEFLQILSIYILVMFTAQSWPSYLHVFLLGGRWSTQCWTNKHALDILSCRFERAIVVEGGREGGEENVREWGREGGIFSVFEKPCWQCLCVSCVVYNPAHTLCLLWLQTTRHTETQAIENIILCQTDSQSGWSGAGRGGVGWGWVFERIDMKIGIWF